jgi:hypothetical protein
VQAPLLILYRKVIDSLYHTEYTVPNMSKEERRERARERVKAWKARNPWLVKKQRERRWGRIKEALEAARKLPSRVTNTGTQGYRGKEVIELHYGPVEGVDEMEPEEEGRDERNESGTVAEADGVAFAGRDELSARRGGGPGACTAMGSDRGGVKQVGAQTENEKATYARLEQLKARRRGIVVDL